MKKIIILTMIVCSILTGCEIKSDKTVANAITIEATENETTNSQKTDKNTTKTVINNTNSINYDTIIPYQTNVTLYDFKKEGNVGITNIKNDVVNYEGYAGTRMKIQDKTVKFGYYAHTKNVASDAHCKIYKYGDTKNTYLNAKIIKDKTYALDISKYVDGLYVLETTYVYPDKSTISTKHHFYVKNKDAYMCSVHIGNANTFKTNRDAFFDAIKDVNPKDCLDITEMTYPTSGSNGRVVHVDIWKEVGKKIIKDDWTDEAKVFAFTMHIAQNIAYDEYKADVIKYSRARVNSTDTHDGYTDDNNFAYYNRVGVCWDYANILAIMCRSNGIPCTSIEVPGHTYNAVYLDGHWMQIDITRFYWYQVNGKDTSIRVPQPDSARKTTNAYGTYIDTLDIVSVGKQIWTYENATNPDNNASWVKNQK